jgi:hypothetical protein
MGFRVSVSFSLTYAFRPTATRFFLRRLRLTRLIRLGLGPVLEVWGRQAIESTVVDAFLIDSAGFRARAVFGSRKGKAPPEAELFFFTLYCQNTRWRGETRQNCLGVLDGKSFGIMGHYFGLEARLLTIFPHSGPMMGGGHGVHGLHRAGA